MSTSMFPFWVSHFDSENILKQNVAKKCFYKLKNMLMLYYENAAKARVHTMITSKLDYCNAILYGLPDSTLKHFARVSFSFFIYNNYL